MPLIFGNAQSPRYSPGWKRNRLWINLTELRMKRWLWFSMCGLLGLGLLFCGLVLPAHLRAVDASVLAAAGRGTRSFASLALALVQAQQLGAAQMLLLAAQQAGLPERQLAYALDEAARQHPASVMWGADTPLARLFESDATPAKTSKPEPFTEFIVRAQNRETMIGL